MAGTLGIFGICLLFAGVQMTSGMTVTIPNQVYKVARGDKAVIPCAFTPSTTITSISWTADPDNKDDPEINVAGYFSGGNKITIYKKYKGRANIVLDLVKGTANLELLSVTNADTRDYECKVQDPDDEEGRLSDKANLMVLVAPSQPKCNIVGKTEYFENIELRCLSEEGMPIPVYKWQSYSVNNVPRPLPPKATEQSGVLSLLNISMDTSGYYICTSTNEIKSATCNVTLRVDPPSMNIASTAGIIGGVVGVALVVGIIICCCCYCRRRREKAEEFAMGKPEGEYTDEDYEGKEDDRDEHVKYEEERRLKSADRRDPPDDRSERSYDRRSDYTDRKDQYTDRRDDRSDRSEKYDRDDRRDRYDDRRERNDDRRERNDDRRDRYDARGDRYDDRRERNDDRRDRYDDRYDSDRYSDRYDSRDRPPSVPPNKPKDPKY
ncbi:glycoprotein A33 (transmembrane), paralog a isoform X1 [Carassius gibelio]|uniref:glycoprotein A33 (transmembrane), paralog a isoform X1 n=1 Tax=Carassius gibelio TaxID=101364 RepID=UPI002277A2F5|nr:glycoprotein A33 (transmembrane), paralog a isoform X1 [Carassius gibelio]